MLSFSIETRNKPSDFLISEIYDNLPVDNKICVIIGTNGNIIDVTLLSMTESDRHLVKYKKNILDLIKSYFKIKNNRHGNR